MRTANAVIVVIKSPGQRISLYLDDALQAVFGQYDIPVNKKDE